MLSEPLKIGDWYCDECETHQLDPSNLISIRTESGVPQIYIDGFHVHVNGENVVPVSFCIWVNADFMPGILEVFKAVISAQEVLELEERLRRLTIQPREGE